MFIIFLTINIVYSLNRITGLVIKTQRLRVYFYVGDELYIYIYII